ncbi:MAG: glycoside hydrolase family 15 protein [Acidimicrobiia bacterium]
MGTDPYPPISDYALIGDCHSAALISRDGSVDWCCFPRFDGRPVFGRLLDWGRGGHFRIAPCDQATVSRRYLPGTNVLETRFETEGGVLVLTDCLPVQEDREGEPYHQLLRLARCEEGELVVAFEFRPRFDYGLTVPRLEMLEPDLGIVYGGADGLVFQSELPMDQIDIGSSAAEEVPLAKGDEAFTALTYSSGHRLSPHRLERAQVVERIEETRRFWSTWSERCRYQGPYREYVVRSALALKALTYAPTGAIVAAPTTSLPEEIGGERNWDYRYTWLRDAALELYALFRLGYTEEAQAFMRWIRHTTAGHAEGLQVVYGIGGERLLPEFQLDLEGYRGSRPVRVGNSAAHQLQLDAYGYLLDTAWLYHRYGGEIDRVFWEFLAAVAEETCRRWEEPEQGIWEVRSEPRQFVSSKVLAWVALDRAIRLAERLAFPGDLEHWRSVRKEIRRAVDTKGVDPQTGAFVQAFGADHIDASALLFPLVRFVPPDDPRVRATVEQVEARLTHQGLVYRYLTEDGVPGPEGSFLICGFWLVSNLALIGEVERATQLFESLCRRGNDVGLLAEEVSSQDGSFLGNFPQAFSHVGLIGAALNLEEVSRRPGPRPG